MNLPPPLSEVHGAINIEGCSVLSLVKKYGTPIYVYSETRLRSNYRRLQQAFVRYYPNFKILYALKANSNPAIAGILISEGSGIDACNPSEIWLARKLRLPESKILYTGNYCTNEELEYGFRNCGQINLDDATLLPRLLKYGKPRTLSFRINPGIGKGSIKTNVIAGPQAKFGIPIENAIEAYSLAQKAGIKRFGIHMMTGSCVLEPDYFGKITGILLSEAGRISKKLGINFEFIDIGGGFGIPYLPSEKPLDIERTARLTANIFIEKCRQYGMKNVTLMVEPGRYFTGDSGVLLGTVQMVKQSYQRFAGTDVTINHLVRPKMYGAYHHIVIANKFRSKKTAPINVCGSLCDNGDILAKGRNLPLLERGDIAVFLNAGAYGFSMSSQYNTRSRAREILVNGKQSAIIREAETTQDLFSRCKKAPWL